MNENLNYFIGLYQATKVIENTNNNEDVYNDLMELIKNNENNDFKTGVRFVYKMYNKYDKFHIKVLLSCYQKLNSVMGGLNLRMEELK